MKKFFLILILLFTSSLFSQELKSKVLKVSKSSKKIQTILKDKGITVKYIWLEDKDDNETKFIIVDGKAKKYGSVDIETIWVDESEEAILNEEQVKSLLKNPYCPKGYSCVSAYEKIKGKIPAILTLADNYEKDGGMTTIFIFEYYPLGTNKVVYYLYTYHLSASNLELRGDILSLAEKQGTEYLSIEWNKTP
ncbi:hypothetical protein [Ornithobacterium rhinotracheale]|uniref:hypothetical protein n=1 Tax=Ornithobacterium rhinotracheale TaxID=28251 RepID=UPI001628478C|nr:hypothetical protein [Ornithobacterium rhinotracheale]